MSEETDQLANLIDEQLEHEQTINIDVVGNEFPAPPLNVSLFLRKLWKMVNDDNARDIISWNDSGDGFIIHDQVRFISELLPQYFKHNNMASFVRQLNFYDFHKVSNIDKDEIHFAHNYFLKDLPQTLAFIKRKCTQTTRSRKTSEGLTEILDNIREMKGKHEVVNSELERIQQENEDLWEELNSLRLKHSKQCKVINKLIHFLITYMQSRSMGIKRRLPPKKVSSPKRLKAAPRLLELDYRRKQQSSSEPPELELDDAQNKYTVTEPNEQVNFFEFNDEEDNGNIDLEAVNAAKLDDIRNVVESESSVQPKVVVQPVQIAISEAVSDRNTNEEKTDQNSEVQIDLHSPSNDKTTYNSQPSTSQMQDMKVVPSKSPRSRHPMPFNMKHSPKENFGLYIDNTQLKLDTIKDMLHNMTPRDVVSLYEILQENYDQQADFDNIDLNELARELEDAPMDKLTPEIYKSITANSESEPIKTVKQEIEDELQKELAGMEVLSQFQPSTSTASLDPTDLLSNDAPDNSDNVNMIIDNLIAGTGSNVSPEETREMEKALEEELAGIVAANNSTSNVNPTRSKSSENRRRSKKQ